MKETRGQRGNAKGELRELEAKRGKGRKQKG